MLCDATVHLETAVLVPLEEICQRTGYRVDVLREVYAAQVAVLKGGDNESGSGSAAGLAGRIDDIKERQAVLDERLKKMTDTLSLQKEMVAAALDQCIVLKSRVSVICNFSIVMMA